MLQAGFYDVQSHEKNKRVAYYFGSGCLKALAHNKIQKNMYSEIEKKPSKSTIKFNDNR